MMWDWFKNTSPVPKHWERFYPDPVKWLTPGVVQLVQAEHKKLMGEGNWLKQISIQQEFDTDSTYLRVRDIHDNDIEVPIDIRAFYNKEACFDYAGLHRSIKAAIKDHHDIYFGKYSWDLVPKE